MSRKSNDENRATTSRIAMVAAPRGATPQTQASHRWAGGRPIALITVLLAVVGICAGWYLMHRGSHPVADKADPPAEAASPLARIDAIHNVLLVSIDTCRADRLSCYGYPRPTTPNIDALAREGALFKMALTPVPLTTPAHSSMFTGTYPPTHGVHLNDYDHLADSNVTLAKILQGAGYQTAAFVAAFPLDARFGLNQGFETYDGRFSDEEKAGSFSRRAGEEVNRPALAWLNEHAKRPFFLFLHYFDAHHPYTPHPPFTSAYADHPYAGEIAYIDDCIGRVVDRLRELGVYDNTLVIITGDHGEGLGEHGEFSHCYFIYQSTLHVPLVIRAPCCGKGLQVDANVSLVDIVPTVLDLLGLERPARVQGISLRPALQGGAMPDAGRSLYTESLYAAMFGCSPLHGIVEAGWKYILAPRPELYDLTRDPGEGTNLAGQQPQVARRLRDRLEAMLSALEKAASRRGTLTVDPEAVKRLQSLGYVSGGVAPPASALDISREDPKDFLPIYDRVFDAFGKFYAGRKEEAKKELLEIAAIRPAFVAPHRMLAEIAVDERRLADAAQQYAKIVAILEKSKDLSRQLPGAREDLGRAHLELGIVLQVQGKAQEAIGHFQEALRIKPELALNRLKPVLAAAQSAMPAVERFERALRAKPDDSRAQNNLVKLLRQVGQVPDAIRAYEQTLPDRPGDEPPHDKPGDAPSGRNPLDEAEVQYRKALEIQPELAEAHYNLGCVLAGRGKGNEAIVHFRKALEIKPDYADAYDDLGLVLAGRGKADEAEAQYRKALEIQPDLAEAHCHLGTVLDGRGKAGEAIAQYRKALEIAPDYAAAHFFLAKALAAHGQVDEAIAQYRKVLEIAPNFIAAHVNLGVALIGRGQVDEAIAQYQKVLEIEPGYAEAHNDLGAALAGRGRTDEAMAHFRKALEIKPGYAEAHVNLGDVLARRGQIDEAIAHYQTALDLASARNDGTLAGAIRERIQRIQGHLAPKAK